MDTQRIKEFMDDRERLSQVISRLQAKAGQLLTDIVAEQPDQKLELYDEFGEQIIDARVPVETKYDTMDVNIVSMSAKGGKLRILLEGFDTVTLDDIDYHTTVAIVLTLLRHFGITDGTASL